jgi:hypothetical protein
MNPTHRILAAMHEDDAAAIARHVEWLQHERGARSLRAMLPVCRIEVEVTRSGAWHFTPQNGVQLATLNSLVATGARLCRVPA